MYKALFFDLDDTLWAFSQNAEETFRNIYSDYRFGRYFISFEDFYSLYLEKNREMWAAYGRGEIDRDTLNEERFRYPLERVGIFDKELVENYTASFFEQIVQHERLMPGAKEVLDNLSQRYPLYIISNGFRELQYKKMDSSGISSYFRNVYLSDDIGYNKPHPAIFDYALDDVGIQPNEAIMIGDNWNADIQGARKIGMDQVYIASSMRDDAEFSPTHYIGSLEELLLIFE